MNLHLVGLKKRKSQNYGFKSIIHEYAQHFWHESCSPSPNPKHKTVLFSGTRGLKRIIPNRIQFHTGTFLYDEFCKRLKSKFPNELNSTGVIILPSYNWFMQKKLPWIKMVDKTDYAYCTIHANMRWIRRDIRKVIDNGNLHECRSKQCANYLDSMGDACTCVRCESCELSKLFEQNFYF